MVASPAVDLLLAVGVARRWWRPRRYSQLSASALDLEPATTAGAATAKRYNKRSFIGRDEEGDDGCCYGFSIWSRDDVVYKARELLNCLELALLKIYELGGWSKWWLFLCLHALLGLILLLSISNWTKSLICWIKNGDELPSSANRGKLHILGDNTSLYKNISISYSSAIIRPKREQRSKAHREREHFIYHSAEQSNET